MDLPESLGDDRFRRLPRWPRVPPPRRLSPGWPSLGCMRAFAGLALLVWLAACAAPGPGTGEDRTGTSAVDGAPAGWTPDACDSSAPAFSDPVQPVDAFRRAGAASARSFVARIAEAAGDAIAGNTTSSGAADRNDAHAFQTRDGVIEAYWDSDPAAWGAEYRATMQADGATGRNQTAHAILGALQVPVEGLVWRDGPVSLEAHRLAGGAGLLLVRIEDQAVEAEQASLLRRDVRVGPDYALPSGLMGLEKAAERADDVLRCANASGGPELQAAPQVPELRVDRGIPVYWVLVEPRSGWANGCPGERAGQLHVALDAVTGTVVSAELAC